MPGPAALAPPGMAVPDRGEPANLRGPPRWPAGRRAVQARRRRSRPCAAPSSRSRGLFVAMRFGVLLTSTYLPTNLPTYPSVNFVAASVVLRGQRRFARGTVTCVAKDNSLCLCPCLCLTVSLSLSLSLTVPVSALSLSLYLCLCLCLSPSLLPSPTLSVSLILSQAGGGPAGAGRAPERLGRGAARLGGYRERGALTP